MLVELQNTLTLCLFIDINECTSNNGGCDPDATCVNTPGSFRCQCGDGYTGNGNECFGLLLLYSKQLLKLLNA